MDGHAPPYHVPASLKARLQYKRRQLRPDYLGEALRCLVRAAQDRRAVHRLRAGRTTMACVEAEPLVTVRIATYSAGELLRRAVDSALRQTYPRIEVLVVGDRCDAQTVAVAESYGDRIRFLQLGHRGQYPAERADRWMVAGAAPMNVALDLARGEWLPRRGPPVAACGRAGAVDCRCSALFAAAK